MVTNIDYCHVCQKNNICNFIVNVPCNCLMCEKCWDKSPTQCPICFKQSNQNVKIFDKIRNFICSDLITKSKTDKEKIQIPQNLAFKQPVITVPKETPVIIIPKETPTQAIVQKPKDTNWTCGSLSSTRYSSYQYRK